MRQGSRCDLGCSFRGGPGVAGGGEAGSGRGAPPAIGGRGSVVRLDRRRRGPRPTPLGAGGDPGYLLGVGGAGGRSYRNDPSVVRPRGRRRPGGPP